MSGFPSPSFSLFNGRGLKSKEFSILCHWKLSISTPKKKVKFFSNGDGCAASCCRTFLVDECDSLASPLNNFVRKEIYFQKLQKKHHIKPNLSMFGAPLFPPNLPSLPRCFWTEEITMATGPQPTNQRRDGAQSPWPPPVAIQRCWANSRDLVTQGASAGDPRWLKGPKCWSASRGFSYGWKMLGSEIPGAQPPALGCIPKNLA